MSEFDPTATQAGDETGEFINERPPADYRPEGQSPEPERGYRSLFWPIILIGVGVVVLLANMGLIGTTNWWDMWRLWPVLLIAGGIDLLFARQAPALGALLGIALVGGVIALLMFTPLANSFFSAVPTSTGNLEVSTYGVPLDGVQSTDIMLEPAVGRVDIYMLEDSSNLFEAEIAHLFDLDFDAHGGARRTITLGPAAGSETNLRPREVEELYWDIGIAPDIALDLTIDQGLGETMLDLADADLQTLTVEGGLGSMEVYLPGTDLEMDYNGGAGSLVLEIADDASGTIELEVGVGSVEVFVGEDFDLDISVDVGVGSVEFTIPRGAPVRLIVEDQGIGSVNVPQGFTQIEKGEDGGIWESEEHVAGADNAIEITVNDIGVGSVDVKLR